MRADSFLFLRSRNGSSLVFPFLKLQVFKDFGRRDKFVQSWPFKLGLYYKWLRLQGDGVVYCASGKSQAAGDVVDPVALPTAESHGAPAFQEAALESTPPSRAESVPPEIDTHSFKIRPTTLSIVAIWFHLFWCDFFLTGLEHCG